MDSTLIQLIIVSVVAFLALTLILVGLLLFAKAKLTPSGIVKININDGEREIEVAPGSSLLSTLASNKIFLPSACGGGGTCGMCKCRVVQGGGEILPTEVGFFSRKQIQNNWRLGCQVKVKEDLGIVIPEEVLGIKKWECEVISNHNVATFIKEFVVKLPEGEHLKFKSGGYIQIDIPQCDVDYKTMDIEPQFHGDWDKMKLWDLKMKNPTDTFRAYSMANHPAEGNIVMLNIRVATPPFDRATGGFLPVNPGISSSYIFSRKPGDKVTISGPYGEFFIRPTQNEIVFVGGGAGMAPMRSHIFHLFKTEKTTRKVSFWYGARSTREIFYEEDFRAIEREFPNFSFHIALSDARPEENWTGPTGFIHKVLFDNYIKNHETPEDIEYYLCGPPMMTSAVTKMLDEQGVPAENVMYDNFGA
ncbi:MAG: NADH:ubiquinone reductase (Na(+)-transporting) subunit F [Bacteroidales bacterium]